MIISLSVKAGLVFQELNPTPIKPKPSGWNITTGLFIWAGRLFLDISKTFFISIMSLVLKPNLSPSVYSCGAGVSGISAILEQSLWSASSWSDKPRWVLSLPPHTPHSTPPTRSINTSVKGRGRKVGLDREWSQTVMQTQWSHGHPSKEFWSIVFQIALH